MSDLPRVIGANTAAILTFLGLLALAVGIYGLAGLWWALVFAGAALVSAGVLTNMADDTEAQRARQEQRA